MNQKTTDYIIVGQGLAGTLLAYFLQREGKSVYVIDQEHWGSASAVAAGLINPITGRRFVKSWMIEKLIPAAEATYLELEQLLKIRLYHPRNIIRALFNSREENDWLARSGEAGYHRFMAEEARWDDFTQHTEAAYSYGELLQSAQVDVPLLIKAYRKHLNEKGIIRSERFDYSQIHFDNVLVEYKGIKAEKIIFCEGHQSRYNPYFAYLPFNPAKGEILIVKIPEAGFTKLFKHRVFIAPLGNDLYWVGATNDWDFDNDSPTTEARSFLKERLQDILTIPFEIVTHQAAIRPTVKDRRPMLGFHPHFPALVIFNGLGTKGASLGPYWAGHMTEVLTKNGSLDKRVDIKRFVEIYAKPDKASS